MFDDQCFVVILRVRGQCGFPYIGAETLFAKKVWGTKFRGIYSQLFAESPDSSFFHLLAMIGASSNHLAILIKRQSCGPHQATPS